ncbi:MAG: hypothetical protein H6730_16165 [Deltaproteobacteria bacterium]|nr:hypothetical protein [Deltaproteobacteria bacterium]
MKASLRFTLLLGAVAVSGCGINHYGLDARLRVSGHEAFAPEAPAVVLSYKRHVEYMFVGQYQPVMRVSVHMAVLVRRPEALTHATQLIWLRPLDIQGLEAVTHRPDGSTVRFEAEELWNTKVFEDLRGNAQPLTLIPFRHVVPGSVVELTYAHEARGWSSRVALDLPALPIRDAELRVVSGGWRTPGSLAWYSLVPQPELRLEPHGAPWRTERTPDGLLARLVDHIPVAGEEAPEVVAAMEGIVANGRSRSVLRDWAGPFEEVSEEFEASRKDAALPADLPGPGADEPPRARAARALRWVQDKLRRQPFRWDRQHIRPVKEVVTDRSGTSWERSAVLAALLEGMGLVPAWWWPRCPRRIRSSRARRPRQGRAPRRGGGESLVLDPGCDACGVDEVRPHPGRPGGVEGDAHARELERRPLRAPAPAVAVMERTLPLAEATPRAERLTLALSPRGVMLKRGEVRLRGVEAREINRRFGDGPRDQSDRDAEAKRFLDAWADGEVRWQLGDDVVTAEVQDVLLARGACSRAATSSPPPSSSSSVRPTRARAPRPARAVLGRAVGILHAAGQLADPGRRRGPRRARRREGRGPAGLLLSDGAAPRQGARGGGGAPPPLALVHERGARGPGHVLRRGDQGEGRGAGAPRPRMATSTAAR